MQRARRTIVLAAALAFGALWPGAGQAAETISFGIVSANPNYWAIFVALVFTGSSAAATQALTGGSLQMTVSSTDAAFIAQQKVSEIRQIFSLVGKNPYSLMVTPEIKRVEDLRLSPAGLRKVLENMITLGDLKPPVPDLAPYVDFTLADKLGRR